MKVLSKFFYSPSTPDDLQELIASGLSCVHLRDRQTTPTQERQKEELIKKLYSTLCSQNAQKMLNEMNSLEDQMQDKLQQLAKPLPFEQRVWTSPSISTKLLAFVGDVTQNALQVMREKSASLSNIQQRRQVVVSEMRQVVTQLAAEVGKISSYPREQAIYNFIVSYYTVRVYFSDFMAICAKMPPNNTQDYAVLYRSLGTMLGFVRAENLIASPLLKNITTVL